MPIKPVTGKIEAQSINDNLSYLESTFKNIEKNSPKGTYATLADLQAAFPTGNTNIYIVTADGKWYYWNGSAWVSGGVYQSTGIADNSIETKHIKTVDSSKLTYNIIKNAFWGLINSGSPTNYLSYFQVDSEGNLSNSNTSSSTYVLNSVNIIFPKDFVYKYTLTFSKGNGNGQMIGFTSSADGGTSRVLFGYEPVHSAFELYKNGIGFKVLESDANLLNGDYTFEFRYIKGIATLRIYGSGYDKTFNVADYFSFDMSIYDKFTLQMKIPSFGNNVKNLSITEKKEVSVRNAFDTTGFSKLSERGSVPGRFVHVYKFGGKGNDWCFVRTPANYDPNGKPHPFVIANHGNGWLMDGTKSKANWTKRTMYVKSDDTDYIANPTQYNLVPSNKPELLYSNPTIEALLDAGYVVCGAENYGDNLYGNNDCRNAMADFYFHMIKNFNVEEKCYMIGASNGAMTSLNGMYMLGGINRVKAMILQYPLTNLWRHYSTYPDHQSAIEAAYGISAGLTEAQFESATRTHDPEKVNTVMIGTDRIKTTALPPIKFYYSLGDTVTRANNNTLALVNVLEKSNAVYETVQATGEHGDFSHFDPAAYVAWFEKYR